MISDLTLARVCADAYVLPEDAWDHSWSRDDIHVRHRLMGGFDVIAFRGSDDLEDWFRDLHFWPKRHKALGYCHSGFLEGMERVVREVAVVLDVTARVVITGHSLGAARALIFAALGSYYHRFEPERVVTFGTPRPGFKKLSRVLAHYRVPMALYRNGEDPVTKVPYLLGLYKHPAQQIELGGGGAANPIEDHFIRRYVRAMEDAT